MGNKINKEKRKAYEISLSPYCFCPKNEVPEGLTLDELIDWMNINCINNDPIISYEDIKAPEYYGGHISSWAIRKCLICQKIYSEHPGWA